ncbi:MAG: hypothetical protein NT157_03980 [Candidatus Micrarchaeota archaeon]|nr:hypothetical protein [Candidatus Micrarchaeota archaeon]
MEQIKIRPGTPATALRHKASHLAKSAIKCFVHGNHPNAQHLAKISAEFYNAAYGQSGSKLDLKKAKVAFLSARILGEAIAKRKSLTLARFQILGRTWNSDNELEARAAELEPKIAVKVHNTLDMLGILELCELARLLEDYHSAVSARASELEKFRSVKDRKDAAGMHLFDSKVCNRIKRIFEEQMTRTDPTPCGEMAVDRLEVRICAYGESANKERERGASLLRNLAAPAT